MNIPQDIKKSLFDSSVVSTLIYAGQTLPQTQSSLNKIRTAQRSMERSLLKIRLNDRIRSESIRNRTNFADAGEKIMKMKWDWYGHIARQEGNRWTKLLTEWTPIDNKRQKGRPKKRWRDDIKRFKNNCHIIARDRSQWHKLREEFPHMYEMGRLSAI